MSTNRSDRPALLGGEPVSSVGPPGWPIADADVKWAIDAAYETGSWGKYDGGHVERLEDELARFHGVDRALTCCSGTFAVELALRTIQLSPGDEVILAAYDYGGNFLSVLAAGARPVLVDVDPLNWNAPLDRVLDAIGPRTRAIVASHLHGGVVPVRAIAEAARDRGILVVEDAAQMPGAWIEGRRAGTWGDFGTISFGGSKLLTAGRGGAILTNRPELHQRAKLLCHRANQVYPLSELQAAVLLPQLARLDQHNRTRAANARAVIESIADLAGLRPLRNSIDCAPGYYKIGFQFDSDAFGGLTRDEFLRAVQAEGIALSEGFRALHAGRSRSRYRAAGDLTEARRAHDGMIVLHHPVLLGGPGDVDQVARAIRKIYAFRDALRHGSPPR